MHIGDGTGMRMEGKTQNFFIRHPSAFRGPTAYMYTSVATSDLVLGAIIASYRRSSPFCAMSWAQ
jgi:hypothetical protein